MIGLRCDVAPVRFVLFLVFTYMLNGGSLDIS